VCVLLGCSGCSGWERAAVGRRGYVRCGEEMEVGRGWDMRMDTENENENNTNLPSSHLALPTTVLIRQLLHLYSHRQHFISLHPTLTTTPFLPRDTQ
jgi:hypothetical protein